MQLIFVSLIFALTLKRKVDGSIITSGSSSSISQSCINGKCKSCINEVCYPRGFSQIHKFGSKCPTVACENDCSDLVMWTDDCPICRCNNGVATRQPCNSESDCSKSGPGGPVCKNYLCSYENVPQGLPRACWFDSHCKFDHSCSSDGRCTPGATVNHAENVSCVFPSGCPAGFADCRDMTCYENKELGPESHIPGLTCVFRHQCPDGFTCDNMSCMKSSDGLHHLQTISCALDSTCRSYGFKTCIDLTCIGRL